MLAGGREAERGRSQSCPPHGVGKDIAASPRLPPKQGFEAALPQGLQCRESCFPAQGPCRRCLPHKGADGCFCLGCFGLERNVWC